MKTLIKTLAFIAIVIGLTTSCKETEKTTESTTVMDETYTSEPAAIVVDTTTTVVVDTVNK